jgi:uncharacterized protein YcnI
MSLMSAFHLNPRSIACLGTAVTLAAGLSIVGASSASAHMGVDLHGATPTAGSGSTIFLRPGHGCDGDTTNAMTVTIPDGVTRAKAQQKAGWTLVSDGKTVTWSGGALPDDQFDDFGIKLTWPKLAAGVASQKFYFKTVQTCNAEIKVSRSGKNATVTGWLPTYAGQKVALLVDGIPLTVHDATIGADGRFKVSTTADKVPEGSDVTATLDGRVIANSVAGADAWLDIPVDGSTAPLAMPAPSVTVIAPVAK